jgi:hypothetical protein
MSGQPDRLNAAEPGHGIVSNLMELAIRNAAKIFGLFPDADSGRSGHAACHAKYRLPRSAIEGPPLARPAMLSPSAFANASKKLLVTASRAAPPLRFPEHATRCLTEVVARRVL